MVDSPTRPSESETETVAPPTTVNRGLVLVLAIACSLTAANLYYNQPLLALMAHDFGVPEAKAGLIPTLTQIGYATGLALIVPLGDILERRRLILTLLGLVGLALIGAACAPSILFLTIASCAIGITTVVPQVLLPYAAQLAPPAERGKTVGTVISGILMGILLSRTVSGIVAASFGWRAVYGMGTVLMALLAVTLRFLLPISRSPHRMTYAALLRSVLELGRTQPILREATLSGALLFGSFSVFWATLVFHLSSPTFHLGSREAGLFGLIGAVGAGASPLVGRLADSRSPRFLVGIASGITLASYLIFLVGGNWIIGLVLGVIALDLGVQAAQVSNQTRVYNLMPSATSRLNTFYMCLYFCGGALGSYLGTRGWALAGWPGVCAAGILLSGIAFLANALASQKTKSGESQV